MLVINKNDHRKAHKITTKKFPLLPIAEVKKLIKVLIPVPIDKRTQLRALCPFCFKSPPKDKHIHCHTSSHVDVWLNHAEWTKYKTKRKMANLNSKAVRQYTVVMSVLTTAATAPDPIQRLVEAIDELSAKYADL